MACSEESEDEAGVSAGISTAKQAVLPRARGAWKPRSCWQPSASMPARSCGAWIPSSWVSMWPGTIRS